MCIRDRNRIGHIALRVENLERAKSFYIKLGMYLVWDEKDIVLETLLSFKRAGAKLILTYHACDASKWLQDN